MKLFAQMNAASYAALYKAHATVDAVLDKANAACSHRTPIHGCVVSLNGPLEGVIRKLTEGRGRTRGFRVKGVSPYLIEVPFAPAERLPHPGTGKALLWSSGQDSTVCLVGVGEDFDYLWQELQRYLYSDITRLFLRTADFETALHNLRRANPDRRIRISGYTANVLCDDGKRVKTRREWLKRPKPEADFFGELEQEKQWLRSLEVVIEDTQVAQARIKRDMTFSCQAGFRRFYETVLESLRTTAAQRRGIFQNRGAVESPTHAPRPIQISYDRRVFEDKSQNRRLIRVLKDLPDCALSVFHANPFLHASIVDYSDGSCYALWVTDSSAITVTPELKVTAASLARLCNHINEHFSEGSIEEVRT